MVNLFGLDAYLRRGWCWLGLGRSKGNRMHKISVVILLGLSTVCVAGTSADFQKRWLSAQFFAEGANCGDFNKDGKMDIVSGPIIYDGPDFMMKHAYTDGGPHDPLGYSKNFFAFSGDFNADGWTDVF